jgi:hypothetical protein
MFISAYPPARRINLFDANMKLVNGNESKETLSQTALKSQGNQQKMAVAEPTENLEKKQKSGVRRSPVSEGDDVEKSTRKRSRGR